MENDHRVQDRGMKKWTAMMLPEHQEQLKSMWIDQQKHERPTIDEQELEEFNKVASLAYAYTYVVRITYCVKHVYDESDICEVTGTIKHVNSHMQTIEVANACIRLDDCFTISIVNEIA